MGLVEGVEAGFDGGHGVEEAVTPAGPAELFALELVDFADGGFELGAGGAVMGGVAVGFEGAWAAEGGQHKEAEE